MNDSYRYEQLARREIRLIHLYPRTENDGIRCTIERVSIDDNPPFEALSYTWGSAADKVPIEVGSDSLSVTRNLAAALHALCPQTSQRTLWIDAICIDQTNAAERNHQVLFMKDIYKRAGQVIVWLGDAGADSDSLMDYLETVDPDPSLAEHKDWVYSESWDWELCSPWKPPPVEQACIDDLLCRPWFSRVWIQQEAAVNAATHVLCGSKQISWNQLFSLVWSYQKPSGEGFAKDALSNDAQASAVLVLTIQSYRYSDIPTLLLDILRDCTYCGATDPRDRIYAVQSLARDPDLEKLVLEPNYNHHVATVYTALAKRYLQVQGPFVLSWAGRNNQRFHELPSWAPDWTVKNIELPSIIFNASGGTQGDCKIVSQNDVDALSTYGITVGSISVINDIPAMDPYQSRLGEPDIFQSLRKHIKECVSMVQLQTKRNGKNTNMQDLWRVLAVDSTRSWTRLPAKYEDNLAAFPTWLNSHSQGSPLNIPGSYLEYLETLNLRGVFIYRRFAIDSEGRMCLVPYSAKHGDLVAIITGLALPLVIRDTGKGAYEIIGESYVHGCMDGETIQRVGREGCQELVFC